jgi:hypothetical protein
MFLILLMPQPLYRYLCMGTATADFTQFDRDFCGYFGYWMRIASPGVCILPLGQQEQQIKSGPAECVAGVAGQARGGLMGDVKHA